MGQRLTHQDVFGHVVNHIALLIDDPVLPMRGVGIERYVGQYAQLRHRVFQRAHRALHQPFRVIGFFRMQRFQARLDHREQEITGTPSLAMVSASLTSRSIVMRDTPGIEATSS